MGSARECVDADLGAMSSRCRDGQGVCDKGEIETRQRERERFDFSATI